MSALPPREGEPLPEEYAVNTQWIIGLVVGVLVILILVFVLLRIV